MKLAIMQPYFLPYIGYFQLINAVDSFIVYDNIQYTKKGWINRNRYLHNVEDRYFTIPLQKDSDYLDVRERFVADNFDKVKLLNQIKVAYYKAPYYKDIYPLFENIIMVEEKNLFQYIYNSIEEVIKYLEIKTEILISSKVLIDHELKSVDKVISLCREVRADVYINSAGGISLYDKAVFLKSDIDLLFLKTNQIIYKQFRDGFVPSLSILDVLMFNSRDTVKKMLKEYTLF